MVNTQQTTTEANTGKLNTSCNCQNQKEQGVLPGCQNCIDGSVCSEMYEALRACKVSIIGDEHYHEFWPLIQTIDRALAKAEGET